jgi:hypothetical protein
VYKEGTEQFETYDLMVRQLRINADKYLASLPAPKEGEGKKNEFYMWLDDRFELTFADKSLIAQFLFDITKVEPLPAHTSKEDDKKITAMAFAEWCIDTGHRYEGNHRWSTKSNPFPFTTLHLYNAYDPSEIAGEINELRQLSEQQGVGKPFGCLSFLLEKIRELKTESLNEETTLEAVVGLITRTAHFDGYKSLLEYESEQLELAQYLQTKNKTS